MIINRRPDPLTRLFAFQSNYVQSQIHAMASGSTVQHMRVPDSKKLVVPLPPIKDQKIIIDRIDFFLDKTVRLDVINRQKLVNLAELKQSLLHKSFSGELTKGAMPTKREAAA